jgi:hypothetical protein
MSSIAGKPSDSKVLNYFCEVAIQAEWSNVKEVHKWEDDIKIYKLGSWPKYMSDELDSIIAELNELIEQPQILLSSKQEDANFKILLGTADEYLDIEPHSGNTEVNWGYFRIHWNNKRIITRGSMYVDLENTSNNQLRMHLLREELTQSLGLMNDSEQYDDSIFYQDYSETTEFSEIDRLLIKLLYRPEIKPEMDKSTAKKLIKKEMLIESIR